MPNTAMSPFLIPVTLSPNMSSLTKLFHLSWTKKNGRNTYFHEKYGEEKPRFANA
jgi:hypothetical protein